MTTRDELRIQAANDHAWAEARAAIYRGDGGAVPEPIARLSALAKAVTDQPVAVEAPASTSGSLAELAALRDAIGAKPGEDGVEVAKRLVKEWKFSATTALRDMAKFLDLHANKVELFAGPFPGPFPEPTRGGEEDLLTPDRRAMLAAPLEIASVTANRPPVPFKLQHGLVLSRIEDGCRVLFSETAEGAFVVQTVAVDGLSAGPSTACADICAWTDARWRSSGGVAVRPLSHWREKAADLPVTTPPVIAAPAKSMIKVSEWQPDATTRAGFATTLREKAIALGLKVEINVERLLEKFRATKKPGTEFLWNDVEVKDPGVVFFHFAVNALKGG